jgi:hypothetical protein
MNSMSRFRVTFPNTGPGDDSLAGSTRGLTAAGSVAVAGALPLAPTASTDDEVDL